MMGEPTSADYDKTFNFGQSSDVKLSPTLNTQAAEIEEECDPLGQDTNKSQPKDSDELGHLLAKVLRFHPFMGLFNVCATSMYLDKKKGSRMRLFSIAHPKFRRVCMIGEFTFTTLLAVLIILAIYFTIMKFFGIQITWPIVLSVPCVGR